MAVEIVAALWTRSLALLADAGHTFTDLAGLTLAFFAMRFATKPPTPEKTYGHYRVEILASVLNGMLTNQSARFAKKLSDRPGACRIRTDAGAHQESVRRRSRRVA